mmetsp:Transcript_26119/g.67741  ORF Transcript_26119/g.67741 Transcript_26119/m.67741 type:complete len:479 (-) Transcript_26119:303-1739(-)
MDDSTQSLRAADPLAQAAAARRARSVTPSSTEGSPRRRSRLGTPPPSPARATPSPAQALDDSLTLHNSAGGETASSPSRHTSDDEFDLDEIFATNPSTPKGRYAKWLRASGPMTIRRSKEEHPPSPSASSSSSSSPRHWQGSSELDELHGRAKTRRPLPERIVGDGCALPEFDYATLGEVDEPMASGKQAFVYEVTVHRKRAALKVMRRELAEVVAERRAFVRECHLLARIKHAHIVPLYGVSTTLSGLPCVLLRYCDNTVIRSLRLDEVGHDPEVRATVKREWPSRERLRLMGELADALDHLHTRAILGAHVAHRDIKPPNFGLTATRSLVLYDFGLSVALLAKHSTRGDSFELTGDTGTRRYMSPEVAEGKPYGVSVDVYGWAICAHEIFHLRGKPFHGLSVSQHTERVVKNGARPVIPSTWDHRLIELFPSAWATADRRCDAAKCRDVCRDIVSNPGPEDPLSTKLLPTCQCTIS